MDDFTIISYPGSRENYLLSLTETSSRYMLPFAGKFRVVDFTIGNSISSGARRTIIYSDFEDGLEEYVENYGPFNEMIFPPIKVVTRKYSDLEFSRNLIMDTNTEYYIIYNGDNPSIIDFSSIMKKYIANRNDALLFRLNINDKPSMAYKLLVTNQKTLLNVINKAITEGRNSPNIFEMIINIMINNRVKKREFNALYWPIKNVPEYYSLNREVIFNPELFNLLYNEKRIKSQIKTEGWARIGRHAQISNSVISDYCNINGRVENSIIFPGVEIGEKSIVKDSIILPYVKVGSRARIIKSIIDERTVLDFETEYLNIGDSCRIGTDEEFIKNNDFPKALFSSITIIGKDNHILNGSMVGGGCYVASGLGEEFFSKKKYLYDGLSVIK